MPKGNNNAIALHLQCNIACENEGQDEYQRLLKGIWPTRHTTEFDGFKLTLESLGLEVMVVDDQYPGVVPLRTASLSPLDLFFNNFRGQHCRVSQRLDLILSFVFIKATKISITVTFAAAAAITVVAAASTGIAAA